ncbi:MAG: C39 family peptidase [bacterium]|nr:C39 family peptidase [bacterium]
MSVFISFLKKLLISSYIATASVSPSVPSLPADRQAPLSVSGASLIEVTGQTREIARSVKMDVPKVPFYSQFADISDPKWQGLGCGVASLAMLIEFYKPGIVNVDNLLQEGINAGAFIPGAGWSHNGLVLIANKYGLRGSTQDLSKLDSDATLAQLEELLNEGPVIASVHYKLEPGNPIPHLIVVNGIKDGLVYFNDPASAFGGKTISVQDFMKAWKKRIIVVRP